MLRERIIGTTTITAGSRISLLDEVRKILEEKYTLKIKDGDKIVFYQSEKGEVLIRPA
jgi:hypothetical protein